MRRSTHCRTRIPRAMLPALRAGGPSSRGPMKPGNARPDDPPGPRAARSRAAERAPEPRPRARVEGAAAAVGPHPAPDVLVPRELPGGARPRVHRPLLAARRRRPRPVLAAAARRPLQACAEGRIGVGNDLNPLAHVLTAAKLEPATPAEARDPARGAPARWAGEAADWLALADATCIADPATRRRASRPPAAATAPTPTEPVPDEVSVAFHPRTLPAAARPLPPPARRPRRTGSSPARWPGILHGKTPAYLSTSCPTPSAWRRATSWTSSARTGFPPPERDVFDCAAAKLDRLYRQPLPRDARASPSWATRGPPAPLTRRAARPRAAGPGPPRRHLAALPAGAQVRLLQLAADVDARASTPGAIDAALDDAHQRAPYLAFLRDVLADLRPALTDDGIVVVIIGDVETDRGKPSSGGSAWRSPSGRRRRTRRATGSRAWSGTRSPPTAR